MGAVYLDNAATTPPSDGAQIAMAQALQQTWGNPSSPHSLGAAAEQLVQESRRRVANAVGAAPDSIVFTSGGTEANVLALLGAAQPRRRRKPHVITTNVEHSSVANAARVLAEKGFSVTHVAADKEGRIHAERVLEALTPDTGLVSIIWVNNEVGAVNDVLHIADQIKKRAPDALVHTDAVQAFGHVPMQLEASALDLVTVSAHKIRGPKGVGALWVRKGVRLISPWGGGSQEGGVRPGTENVPGIAGFGAAAQEAHYDPAVAARMGHLRERLWNGLSTGLQDKVELRRNGPQDGAAVAPHILNVSFVGLKGEVFVHALAEAGVYASTGSACSARRGGGSTTLRALGLSEKAVEGGLRFSLSPQTDEADIDQAVARICATAVQLLPFVR